MTDLKQSSEALKALKKRQAMLADMEERLRDPDAYYAKQRIEIWGDDPGPGGINDSSRCVYSPTMNYDWHDDMVCDGVRLYLLPNDQFITRDELERAANDSYGDVATYEANRPGLKRRRR